MSGENGEGKLTVVAFTPSPLTPQAVECVKRTCAKGFISSVQLFLEGVDSVPDEILGIGKLEAVLRPKRPTFTELFQYSNEKFPGQLVVVTDAAIAFNDSIAPLWGLDLTDTLLCLGRANNLSPHAGQDAWIFKAPIRDFPSQWVPGTPGADRRIAKEAYLAGLAVLNPSYSIRIMRQGPAPAIDADRVEAPHLEVPPCRIEAIRRAQP